MSQENRQNIKPQVSFSESRVPAKIKPLSTISRTNALPPQSAVSTKTITSLSRNPSTPSKQSAAINSNRAPAVGAAQKLISFRTANAAHTSNPNQTNGQCKAGLSGGKSSISTNGKQPKSIKKAYVRFDDYLDLNEENMRRSCKRLMNRLYCEPALTDTTAAATTTTANTRGPGLIMAPAISSQSPVKCTTPPLPPSCLAAGAQGTTTVESEGEANNDSSGKYKPESESPIGSDLASAPATIVLKSKFTSDREDSTTLANAASGGASGKSYLRSQYERRRQRQLQLIMTNSNKGKMQQESDENIATGASNSRPQRAYQGQHQLPRQQMQPQQQDLVAMSHELSKRRFFEKLERRESLKNSNLGTQIASVNSQCNGSSLSGYGNERLPQPKMDRTAAPLKSSSNVTTEAHAAIMLNDNGAATQMDLRRPSRMTHGNLDEENIADSSEKGDKELPSRWSLALDETGNDFSNANFNGPCPSSCTVMLEESASAGNPMETMSSGENGLPISEMQLIEFHTLKSTQAGPLVAGEKRQALIDFSADYKECEFSSKNLVMIAPTIDSKETSPLFNTKSSCTSEDESHSDQSAFEIIVPASEGEPSYHRSKEFPADRPDEFIGSSRLVVKQVVAAEVEALSTANEDSRVNIPATSTSSSENNLMKGEGSVSRRKILYVGSVIESSNHCESNEYNRVINMKHRQNESATSEEEGTGENSAQVASNKLKSHFNPNSDGVGLMNPDNDHEILTAEQEATRNQIVANPMGDPTSLTMPPKTPGSLCDKAKDSKGAQTSKLKSASPTDSDNQHHDEKRADISSAISRSSGTDETLETISSSSEALNQQKPMKTTDQVGPQHELSQDKRLVADSFEAANKELALQQAQVGIREKDVGASNCVGDHEAPETAPQDGATVTSKSTTLVGQSGASSGAHCDTHCTVPGNSQVVNPPAVEQKQNAASMQQEVGAHAVSSATSAETEAATIVITKQLDGIRDVLPQANRINGPLGIVSNGEAKGSQLVVRQRAADDEKSSIYVQVNEKMHTSGEREKTYSLGHINNDRYANPSRDAEKAMENNVNHDVPNKRAANHCSGSATAVEAGKENDNLIGANNRKHGLIEPSRKDDAIPKNSAMVQRGILAQRNSPPIEEDRGSSCSSSGFGASVSVTSASETGSSCLIGKEKIIGPSGTIEREPDNWRLKSSALTPQKSITPSGDFEFHYDSIRRARAGETKSTTQRMTDEFGNCTPLGSNSPNLNTLSGLTSLTKSTLATNLIVENHNYAVVNRCSVQPHLNAAIILERDELIYPAYVNMPRGTASQVEYATLRGTYRPSRRYHDSASETSLEDRSLSSGSANSAGFSTLPPARLDCPPTNNFESLISLPIENSQQRKSSLLKRFGSLVSRAFTSNSSAPAPASGKKLPATDPKHLVQEQKQEQIDQRRSNSDNHATIRDEEYALVKSASAANSDANCADEVHSSAALVIECSQELNERSRPNAQVRVNPEADLVILPGKRSLMSAQVQRKQVVEKKFHSDQSDLNHKPNQRSGRRKNHRHHDVKLSRARRHSRNRSRLQEDDLSSSVTSISSTLSYSTSFNSGDYHSKQGPYKSTSLSEELESLVSRSIETDSLERSATEKTCKALRSRSTTKLLRHRSKRTSQQKINSTSGRIDIDCVSPGDLRTQGDKTTKRRSSLLRLFHSDSTSHEATAEPSPNLTNPSSQNCRSKSSKYDCSSNQNEHISGFWGFSSLMETGHASDKQAKSGVSNTKNKINSKLSKECKEPSGAERDSLIYSNLQSVRAGNQVYSSLAIPQEVDHKLNYGSQSLTLYQSLLRNYVNHRHRGHGRHNNTGRSGGYYGSYRHHHHHRSRKNHRSSTRGKPHHSTTRCVQACSQSSWYSSSESLNRPTTEVGSRREHKSNVWGQLIKISKKDGSQVVELYRSPGKSWGFFVARGAINNSKGIFISRMHDDMTSIALSGLLSIGDRILAIDECPIEPDHDILRVNQMISKKSKISLKVEPFKG